jgi:heterodisulfide reductase subunit A-like polyferredoxin
VPAARILYCRCAHAQVVPGDVKDKVLEKLCDSGVAFESVSDLCEMSARRDPRLQSLLADASEEQPVRIAACHPRAVKWLFHAADAAFPEENSAVEVLNMREQNAEEIVDRLKES